MYKEYPVFYNYETLEYDRKSRFDDPYLSVEEVLEKHERMINDYAERYLSGPIPPENKFKEIGSGESIDDRPEMLRLLKAIESPKIKAIIVGRAENNCEMNDEKWAKILSTKKELNNIPIVINADFGHTTPIFTFPIGGRAKIELNENIKIRITN